MQDYKYKAFISYSHKNKRWARWLHRGLESYRVPQRLLDNGPGSAPIPRRLTPVFRDREDLPSSPDLSERINNVLENSENLIVICSPDAAASLWVNQEIQVFKRLGRSSRIFSLIVDGDPKAIGAQQDCFPPVMRQAFDANGDPVAGNVEPIAADVRKSADGPSMARQKIIAGLLGVGLDDLRQREMQRRHRRMAIITAASFAGLLFTAFLAINAYLARNEANQRRDQAEELLGFMVGDIM